MKELLIIFLLSFGAGISFKLGYVVVELIVTAIRYKRSKKPIKDINKEIDKICKEDYTQYFIH